MNKRSDKDKFVDFLNRAGIEYKVFTEHQYIMEEALAQGCTVCLSVRDSVEFGYNARGKFIGTWTCSTGSFRKAKKQVRTLPTP
jgi:hypothetical protein